MQICKDNDNDKDDPCSPYGICLQCVAVFSALVALFSALVAVISARP